MVNLYNFWTFSGENRLFKIINIGYRSYLLKRASLLSRSMTLEIVQFIEEDRLILDTVYKKNPDEQIKSSLR